MNMEQTIKQILALHDLAVHFVDKTTVDQLLDSDLTYLLLDDDQHIHVIRTFKFFQSALEHITIDISKWDK